MLAKLCHPPELLDSIAISKLSSDRRRLQFMVQLSKSVLASASELLDLYTHKLEPVALIFQRASSSLPDELLGSHIPACYVSQDRRNQACCMVVSRFPAIPENMRGRSQSLVSLKSARGHDEGNYRKLHLPQRKRHRPPYRHQLQLFHQFVRPFMTSWLHACRPRLVGDL